jgi:hypothetical protein
MIAFLKAPAGYGAPENHSPKQGIGASVSIGQIVPTFWLTKPLSKRSVNPKGVRKLL